MSSTLNGSSTLECFERGNVIKICNGIMFDFDLGLPHIKRAILYLVSSGNFIVKAMQ